MLGLAIATVVLFLGEIFHQEEHTEETMFFNLLGSLAMGSMWLVAIVRHWQW